MKQQIEFLRKLLQIGVPQGSIVGPLLSMSHMLLVLVILNEYFKSIKIS